jgi:acyl-CoA synthetase (AMP-forming)/AMP-acid ligase II
LSFSTCPDRTKKAIISFRQWLKSRKRKRPAKWRDQQKSFHIDEGYDMDKYLVHHFLEHTADTFPEQIGLISGQERFSYHALEKGANQVAHFLIGQGLEKRDRVALFATNSKFYVDCFYGILKAGGVVVAINSAATPKTLAGCVKDSGARVLFMGKSQKRVVHAAMDEMEIDWLVPEDPPAHLPSSNKIRAFNDLAGIADTRPQINIIDMDLACIIYTSGSTGVPQGATLTHLNLTANTKSILAYLHLTKEDRILAVLPFYYIYGISVLNTHVAVGASMVIENNFLFPQKALDNLEENACTGFSGVPSTFAILLNRSNFKERKLKQLRYVTQAGGAMSPAITKRLMEAIPDKKIFIMYGATEAAGRLSYLPPEDLAENIGSIGRPIDNVEFKIIKEDGSQAAIGETGEIVASGSCIMKGYWNSPDETAGVLDKHGYHTGDLGRQAENGYYYVVGRKKDMIKSGAHRISAKEIEEAVLEHTGVHEVAVVAVPDEILGEAMHAHVVPKSSDINASELKKFLSKRLPAYKIPSRYIMRDSLPKNESGKIMKKALTKP